MSNKATHYLLEIGTIFLFLKLFIRKAIDKLNLIGNNLSMKLINKKIYFNYIPHIHLKVLILIGKLSKKCLRRNSSSIMLSIKPRFCKYSNKSI